VPAPRRERKARDGFESGKASRSTTQFRGRAEELVKASPRSDDAEHADAERRNPKKNFRRSSQIRREVRVRSFEPRGSARMRSRRFRGRPERTRFFENTDRSSAHSVVIDVATSIITASHIGNMGNMRKMRRTRSMVWSPGTRRVAARFRTAGFHTRSALGGTPSPATRKVRKKPHSASETAYSGGWNSDKREPASVLIFLYNTGYATARQLAPTATAPPRFSKGTTQRGVCPAQVRVVRTLLAARRQEDGCTVRAYTKSAP
jgi:hypothetical protein